MTQIPGHGMMIGGTLPPGPQPITTPSTLPAESWKVWGLEPPDPEEDRFHTSILGSLFRGAAAGLIDPLSFIDPVERVVEKLRAGSGDETAEKIGYGLGYLGGFLVPGGLAAKVGWRAAEALHGLKGLQLLRAAEAGVELTRLGMLVQGGVVGALTAPGVSDPHNAKELFIDTATGAVLGGVGDVAIATAFKTIAGAGILGRVSMEVENTVKNGAISETGLSVEEASLAGRAHRIIDDLFKDTDPTGAVDNTVQIRKQNLRMGVDRLGLDNIQPGTAKIIPAFSENIDEIRDVLKNFSDLRIYSATRKVPLVGGTFNNVTDVLVTMKGDLPLSDLASFKQFGFIPGQQARYGGKDYILNKPLSAKYAQGLDKNGKFFNLIDRSKMILNPVTTVNTPGMKINANEAWVDFTRKYGPFPYWNAEGVEHGFDSALEAFSKQRGWTPRQKQDMSLYIAKRHRELLNDFDDGEMGKLFARLEGENTSRFPHPEGELNELASQNGFKVMKVPVKSKSKGKKGVGKVNWQPVLIHNDTGQQLGPFGNVNAAMQYIVSHAGEMPDVTPIGSVAEGAIPLPWKVGTSAELVGQAELSNVTIPASVMTFKNIQPNLHFIRRVNDAIVNTMDGKGPDFYTPFSELFQKVSQSRSEAKPLLDRLQEIHGAGFIRKGVVRPEMFESFTDLFEGARPGTSEFLHLARTNGLNDAEVKAVTDLRQLMRDTWDVVGGKDQIGLDADEFIETILPHVSNRGVNDWVESYFYVNNKMPPKILIDKVNRLLRTGRIASSERDPFMMMYRYINAFTFDKHVTQPLQSLRNSVKQIVFENAPDPVTGNKRPDNEAMKVFKNTMIDTLSLIEGNTGEQFYASRAVIDSLNRSFDLKLDPDTINRFTNTMIAANYGAFLGFRAAQGIRNATQIFMTGLPVLGAKFLGKGMKRAFGSEAIDELVEVGVLAKGESGMPLQDVLSYDQVSRGLEGVEGGRITRAMTRTGQAVRYGTQKSMVFQRTSDVWTRKVMYYGQKERTHEMLLRWRDEGWSQETFDHRVGLSSLGETVTRAFHRMLPRENPEQVAKWLAAQVTNDTMFLYQKGAGPSAFNSTTGKLFGMYGTWPTWYLSFITQNLKRGNWKDRARFIGYTGAVHAAFINTGYVTGVNLSKWTGLQFNWAGGPMFDVLKDVTDIVSGETPSGEPTAKREIALAKHGLQDPGPQPGPDLWRIKDPRRLIEGTAGLFIPGSYTITKDLERAMNQDTVWKKFMAGIGFQIQE